MLTITDFNYEQYKKVAAVLFAFMTPTEIPMPEEHKPMAVLERWEKENRDRAKRGLKIGLLDALSSVVDATREQKDQLNIQLLDKGLPGLYELLNNIWDCQEKVLKAGRIKNDDEYYIIRELLTPIDADFTPAQRKKLEKILFNYEQSRKR